MPHTYSLRFTCRYEKTFFSATSINWNKAQSSTKTAARKKPLLLVVGVFEAQSEIYKVL